MPATARRAFTLVELITVVAIIAIVIAILVPALGGARDIAKQTATNALMNDVLNASLTFENDKQRPPGYFTPTQMGSPDNATRGFTTMENIMLDLAGGVLGNNSGVVGAIEVGPVNASDKTIDVDPELIGAEDSSNPGYFVPAGDRYTTGEDIDNLGNGQETSVDGHRDLPDLVDNFGQPILAWVQDPVAKLRGVPMNADAFAAIDSQNDLAYFYWNANAGFLNSTGLGKEFADQSSSLLQDAGNRREYLAGLLGNPSFATAGPGNSIIDADAVDIFPAAARGSIILQSAGKDGVYLDSGNAGHTAGELFYGLNVKSQSGERFTDSQGRESNIDIIDPFDDLVISGGS